MTTYKFRRLTAEETAAQNAPRARACRHWLAAKRAAEAAAKQEG